MKRVLVVEDDQIVALSLETTLSSEFGFEVTVAFNGQQCLNALEKNRYDIITLDIMMPVMDGFETLVNLRKLRIPTPVIIVSAYSNIDYTIKCMKQGAVDFLTKPFFETELNQAITKALQFDTTTQVIKHIDFDIIEYQNSIIKKDKIYYQNLLKLYEEKIQYLKKYADNLETKNFHLEQKNRNLLEQNKIITDITTFLSDKLTDSSVIKQGYKITQNTKDIYKNKIAEGYILEVLKKLIESQLDDLTKNQLILIQSQVSSLILEVSGGFLNRENEVLERNRITNGLLKIIDRL